MKTSPGTLSRDEIEQKTRAAEHAVSLVRSVGISMDAMKKEEIYVMSAKALDEGTKRLLTFAAAAQRAIAGQVPDPNGPDSTPPATKRRKKS